MPCKLLDSSGWCIPTRMRKFFSSWVIRQEGDADADICVADSGDCLDLSGWSGDLYVSRSDGASAAGAVVSRRLPRNSRGAFLAPALIRRRVGADRGAEPGHRWHGRRYPALFRQVVAVRHPGDPDDVLLRGGQHLPVYHVDGPL